MTHRRTFIICAEHGRVVAYVFTRRNRVRNDGTVAEDVVKVCRLDRRLNHRAWYLLKDGKRKMRARVDAWRAANPEKLAAQRVRANAARRARRVPVAAVASFLLYWWSMSIVSGGGVGGWGDGPGAGFKSQTPPTFFTKKKPRPNPFDACRISPFFCVWR